MYIKYPRHMTKMAAMPIYFIFFFFYTQMSDGCPWATCLICLLSVPVNSYGHVEKLSPFIGLLSKFDQ